MEAYIYILLLIAIASTCHGSLRDTANIECARTWDNGRKKCCEGEGHQAEGHGASFCRNGNLDFKNFKTGKIFYHSRAVRSVQSVRTPVLWNL